MEVEIKIDERQKKPKVVIMTDRVTKEIEELAQKLADPPKNILLGMDGQSYRRLEKDEITRVYSANQKVYAVPKDGEYRLKNRLYEVETQLGGADFIRISNSEIVNLKMVKNLDLSFAGTI